MKEDKLEEKFVDRESIIVSLTGDYMAYLDEREDSELELIVKWGVFTVRDAVRLDKQQKENCNDERNGNTTEVL